MHGINTSGLIDLAGAVARMAVRDLASPNEQHRRSAWKFLDEAGLLARVQERLGAAPSLRQPLEVREHTSKEFHP
jgi:hypothetical protein